MSIIMPDSVLTLYAGVEITDEQQLIFSSLSEQNTYFSNHVYKANVDCSYQKVGDPLTLGLDVDEMYDFNYISFTNTSFENKTIYARVKGSPVYINNETRAINYEIDAWQTWCFDIDMGECAIVREMIDTVQQSAEDTNALNLDNPALFTPEPLSYSESNVNQQIVYAVEDYDLQENVTRFDLSANASYNSAFLRVIVSDIPAGRNDGRLGSNALRGKIYVSTSQSYDSLTDAFTTTFKYDADLNFPRACYNRSFYLDQQGIQDCTDYINTFVTRNGTSNILGMYYLPQIFADDENNLASIPMRAFKIIIPHNGKCAKLNRFPYRFIKVTDPFGNSKEFHLEHFYNATLPASGTMEVTFGVFYVFNSNPQIMLVPKDYKLSGDYAGTYSGYNFEEAMIITQIPQVAFNTDAFLTYLGNEYRGTLEKMSYMNSLELAKAHGGMLGEVGGMLTDSGAPAKIGNTLYKIGAGWEHIKAGVAGFFQDPLRMGSSFDGARLAQNQFDLQNATEQFYQNGEISVTEILNQQRPNYAASEYHAGTSSSLLLNYLTNKCGFELKVIEPHTVIQNEYQKFFNLYGYNQGRFGIPKVMNYIGTGSGNSPIFNNDRTFIKTENCNVIGVNINICRNIESMFNRGIWFKKVVST